MQQSRTSIGVLDESKRTWEIRAVASVGEHSMNKRNRWALEQTPPVSKSTARDKDKSTVYDKDKTKLRRL